MVTLYTCALSCTSECRQASATKQKFGSGGKGESSPRLLATSTSASWSATRRAPMSLQSWPTTTANFTYGDWQRASSMGCGSMFSPLLSTMVSLLRPVSTRLPPILLPGIPCPATHWTHQLTGHARVGFELAPSSIAVLNPLRRSDRCHAACCLTGPRLISHTKQNTMDISSSGQATTLLQRLRWVCTGAPKLVS